MTHIGQIIEKELHRQERSVTWFARRLYCDRTNVYNIFRRQSLDTELLLRISIILEYNFFQISSTTLYIKQQQLKGYLCLKSMYLCKVF